MSGLGGQAARHTGRLLHFLAQLTLGLVVAAAVLLGGAAWRLSQGPLPLPWLTRVLAGAVNVDAPVRITLGSAALAWEGFRAGLDQPLDIRLADVTVSDPTGRRIADLPRAAVSLSAGWLLLGRIVPRAIEADGAWLRVVRAADGGLGLDLGNTADTPDRADATPSTQALPAILAELAHRPRSDHAAGQAARWSQLRRVRIDDAAITVVDHALGVTWRVPTLAVDLRRRPTGGITGQATARLTVADQAATLTAAATLDEPSGQTRIDARLTPVNPTDLARAIPRAAALAALDAPLTLSGSATLGADLALVAFAADADVGAGMIHVAQGTAPLLAAHATAVGTPSRVTLTLPSLVTAPRPDGPRTTLSGHGELARAAGQIQASVTLDLDKAAFADLPALWPEGIAGPGARAWITGNITDGTVHNLHTEMSLTAPEDLSDVTVTRVAGGGDGRDITVHWLRPVPPLQHVDARMNFVSADRIDIIVAAGQEAVGRDAIGVRAGKVVLTGLGSIDQYADIDADLAGPVPAALALLSHPRIKLLARSPLELADASGQFAGHLAISQLKLRDDVTMDDLQIKTSVRLTALRLPGIAAGRDLDRGTLDITANTDGLQVAGQADIAGIPAQIGLNMDFRLGPPDQVQQTVTLTATLDGAQLAGLGLDMRDAMTGSAALSAKMTSRRNQQGDASITADLAGAAIALTPLDWRKPAGTPATLTAHLLLDHDRPYAADVMRAEGDGIHIAGSAVFTDGQPDVVLLDRFELGADTSAHGTLHLPLHPGERYRADIAGRSLDIAGALKHTTTPAKPAGSPPWQMQARFDRLVLGPGRELSAVAAQAEHDGQVLRRLDLDGRTDGAQPFHLAITPQGSGRTLRATAADTGALLAAFDVVDTMRGGRLLLTGVYDDAAAGHPLNGRAEIDNFRIRHAPALAKLLQAMTLYGVIDLVQGPGLFFSRLDAPFRYHGDTLELSQARAFSASLGMTAKGSLDLAARSIDMEGTIVPAYFFNSLLGDLPLIGKLFSPERGGGLFAATYALRGPLDDPRVSVNPLAALTPGFLRGVFGLLNRTPTTTPPPSPR